MQEEWVYWKLFICEFNYFGLKIQKTIGPDCKSGPTKEAYKFIYRETLMLVRILNPDY